MTIIKCDRCGKELNEACDMTVVGLTAGEYFGAVKPERYDLCNSCAETLKIWLHSEGDT